MSVLGRRLDAADGLRDTSGREVLRVKLLSDRSLRGIVSARLGSVSSRISDKGRDFIHDGACRDGALVSPKELSTMPPLLMPRVPFDTGGATKDESLTRSNEGRASEHGPAPGCDCE